MSCMKLSFLLSHFVPVVQRIILFCHRLSDPYHCTFLYATLLEPISLFISFPFYKKIRPILYWARLIRCCLVINFFAESYTMKLSKQHKRQFQKFNSRYNEIGFNIFLGISELAVKSGIKMHGFTINLMGFLVYNDLFFLLFPSETSNHIQYKWPNQKVFKRFLRVGEVEFQCIL